MIYIKGDLKKLFMKKFKILTLIFLIVGKLFSQVSSCTNSDFETGTFSGWNGEIGNCCPVTTSPSGIIGGRHTIMSGTGRDPNTCDVVTVVAPGGVYSARLGNENTGAESEKLTYSLIVSPSNSLFIYKYAVVLEDPSHAPSDQPRFQLRVLNSSGNLIDPICGQYTVVASANIPGFQTCNGSIRYKDWTTVGMDLTPYIGQTITIEFGTGDCAQGGHFGYAYVDAFCAPLQINSTFCLGAVNTLLSAPIGFSYLWSTGETTQSINVINPVQDQTYSCVLTSVTGCTVSISTVINLVQPIATFKITKGCYDTAVFSNTTNVPTGINLDTFDWDFGDGTTSTVEKPSHSFSSPGNYNVIFTISNSSGCTSTDKKTVAVYEPAKDFYCSVDNIFSDDNSLTVKVNGGSGSFLYQLDDEPLQISNVFHQLDVGNHIVTVTDDANCTLLIKKITIMGYPKFFTPNNDGYHDYWNIYYFDNFPEAKINIYDRYGKFIKQLNPLGIGWDGYYNGEKLPSTDYWFTVDYKEININGEIEMRTFRSHFSLKR